jgi:DNA-binding protein HU-beta
MKLPINEIAFIFNVRPVVLMLRIKKCEYLNEKITKLLKRSKPMAISQIVEPMYEITGYQKSNLQFILNKLSDCIKIALEKNNSVQINGLGTFSIKVRKARIGRNPATGESIQIPEKKIVHFKMHKSLKDVFDKD